MVGPDPDHPEPYHARSFSGTSAATPFAAGVAALIWASNPSLSTGEVEDILLRNRRDSTDPEVKKRVIHAYSAVREALTAMVHIQTPNDNGILPAHKPTVFTATTYDDGHGTPFVTWRVDGNVTAVGHTLAPAVAWTAHRDRDRHLRRRDHRHRFDPGDRVQLPADRAHQFAG